MRMDSGQTVCPSCGHDITLRLNPENTLPEGTILAGRYLVGKVLGQGGFGITYLGFDIALNIKVAIKEYFPVGVSVRSSHSIRVTAVSSQEKAEGFRKGCDEFQAEAQRLAAIESPNIVKVRDYFRENGTAYIVMNYLEGSTLTKEVSACGGKMPWQRVVDLFNPMILELDKLHKAHLMHRDIKPDNLKIVKDDEGAERLVLLDFGAARSFVSAEVTGTYSAMVTHGYAPMEQYSPKSRQGPYTDVYALCATMYAVLTGTPPADATDRMLGVAEMASLTEMDIDVPENIEKAIRHGLAVRSEDHPQSMKELYNELCGKGLVSGEPSAVVEKHTPEPHKEEKKEEIRKPAEETKAGKKMNWLLPVLLAVLLAAGFFLYRGIRQNQLNTAEPARSETATAWFITQEAQLHQTQTREAEEIQETAAFYVQQTATQTAINQIQTQTVIAEQTAVALEQIRIDLEQTEAAFHVMETEAAYEETRQAMEMRMTSAAATKTKAAEPTSTPIPTMTATATATPKPTATNTPEPTATATSMPTMTNTPEPTATATPKPTATNTPEPTATATPKPTATNTPEPTATATPKPTATNTPEPTATATLKPTATNTPEPTATETPMPTATNTPEPTATATPKPTATNTPEPMAAATKLSIRVGNIITLGHYEQDGNSANGLEAIEWQVLAVENGRALVISKYGLGPKPYHEERTSVTWETSTLRQWLNGEFYNTAFSNEEKGRIQQVTVENPDNAEYGTKGGNDTIDRIFLLSIDEANTYFKDYEARKCRPTTYAKNNGANISESYGGTSLWWLRSPGGKDNYAADVYTYGVVNGYGYYVNDNGTVVRPTLWLDLNAGMDTAVSTAAEPVLTSEATLSPDALYDLGEAAYKDGDYEKALEYLLPAAEAGNADAQYRLGYMYANGRGVEKSNEEAAKWYRMAADQGDTTAQNILGDMYESGRGVEKSYEEAARWYQRAADQGYKYAQFNLGNLYYNGYGVEKSYEEAAKWFQLAADQEYTTAQYFLGVMYEYGQGVDQSYEEAVKWYQLAADQGYKEAQQTLGNKYYFGRGVDQSYEEAIKWYQLAADQGYAYAQTSLGSMYENGEGVAQSYEEAIKWYQLAADQGHANAQNKLKDLLDKHPELKKVIENTPAVAPGAAQKPTGMPNSVCQVISDTLLRDKPTNSGTVLRSVLKGTILTYSGESKEAEGKTWIHVRTENGNEGWIEKAAAGIQNNDAFSLKAGDILTLGHYEQDGNLNNGPEAIEWQVLAVEDSRALVISKYGLDAKPYNEEWTGVTWENSTLRTWLNGEFYESAFSSEEKGRIQKVRLRNPDNAEYGTKGGNDTTDQIFLLSIEEAKQYFADNEGRQCRATTYAENHRAGVSETNAGMTWWWLRSPGQGDTYAARVNSAGNVLENGYYVRTNSGAVRPVFWVDLFSVMISVSSASGTAPKLMETPVSTNTPEPTVTLKTAVKAGDIITLGHYEQDGSIANGTEAIEWQVLSVEDSRALVISKYGLDVKPYNETSKNVIWETCTLREWLNGDFYNRAFSNAEKGQIQQVTVKNPNNAKYGTKGGNDTTELIFLLSIDEAEQYFATKEARQCKLTAYAKNSGAYVSENLNTSSWWLRSPGDRYKSAVYVSTDGNVNDRGSFVNDGRTSVRPSFWLNL